MYKTYYELPTQVAFYDVYGDHYDLGIAYRDEIICGCCGCVFSIEEILEDMPSGVDPIIEAEMWADISDAIAYVVVF